MLEIVLVILAFSLMIFIHELGHFIMALRVGIKVQIFSLGMGPKLFSVTRNGIEYRLSLIPIGGYIKMLGEDPSEAVTGDKGEFGAQPVWSRFKVLIAGVTLNYILGLALMWIVFMAGYPIITTKVGGLVDDYPAKKAGIAEGDRVLAIDGKPISDWEALIGIMHKKTSGDVKVTVERGGEKMDFTIKPIIKETKDLLGNDVRIAQVGIMNSDERSYLKFGPGQALVKGAQKQVDFVVMTYRGLWNIITGRLAFKENVSGPVGIFNLMTQAAKIGIIPLVLLTALISTLLGVFNILPVPPLDGGLILFLGIEKLRGKPVSKRAQEIAMQAGWMFFIGLMLFATYNDIFGKLGK
ncbi:MAG: RIP metalloprotease RseP [Candidatus Omnitrophica bacterium]|nr:RIP metalloprotease RseP [Candidatus Omnitrophota bacterium]MDD5738283.1 RIP metalloprotease RseP [Candidatus Omnitrophota bacterium]